MVNIVTKKIKGQDYLYLVESIRQGENVRQKTVKYIGPKRPISKEEFTCMQLSYEEKDWILLRYEEQLPYTHHHQMKKASQDYLQHFHSLDSFSQEKERERFLSQFIASSNAIEGSTMTAKDTYNFLFQDIVPSGHTKKELHMALNLLKAWKYVEEHHTKMPTKEDLCALHELVNLDIEAEETLGKYKAVQNYIGEVYTSSYLFVEDKMKRLLRWIKKAYTSMDDFEVAFQSHAQFELIHPFVDGNGRVGRLYLNWLLLKKKYAPLAIRSIHREQYLIALENAQRGNLKAISQFCYEEYMQQYQFV